MNAMCCLRDVWIFLSPSLSFLVSSLSLSPILSLAPFSPLPSHPPIPPLPLDFRPLIPPVLSTTTPPNVYL